MKQRDPNEVDQHVGAKIKELRVQRGITQDALASVLGISFQQIQKYEKGSNRVSAGRLYQIAGHLDAPLLDFFPNDAAAQEQTV